MSGTRTDEQTRSLGAMVSGVTEDLSLLVRGEMALAKSELRQSAKIAATSSALLAVAAFLGLLGLIFLFVTIAYAIVAAGLPVWAGFGIVTLALLLVAALLGGLGVRRFRKVHGPQRTIRQLQQTKELLSARGGAASGGQGPPAPAQGAQP